jgi:hypothetical protein
LSHSTAFPRPTLARRRAGAWGRGQGRPLLRLVGSSRSFAWEEALSVGLPEDGKEEEEVWLRRARRRAGERRRAGGAVKWERRDGESMAWGRSCSGGGEEEVNACCQTWWKYTSYTLREYVCWYTRGANWLGGFHPRALPGSVRHFRAQLVLIMSTN